MSVVSVQYVIHGGGGMQVRKRAAAALKKTKAHHDAQMAQLRAEVEAALQVRLPPAYRTIQNCI